METKSAARPGEGIAGFIKAVSGCSSNPNSDFLHSNILKE
jgi:hypothetical protein